ncbi:transposase [Streptomyces sp. NPDC029674]|uniref:transposase n=1 Tax=Streptomyces sp. NPDC029674 TaxID=3365297 RepID=UPI00384D708D
MDRADRRRRGEPDPLDTQNAARAVLSGRARAQAKAGDGPVQIAPLGSEASFAALCGVSPVERSSGRRQFRRVNRGGARQTNAALHRIVFTRLRVDPRTQD